MFAQRQKKTKSVTSVYGINYKWINKENIHTGGAYTPLILAAE